MINKIETIHKIKELLDLILLDSKNYSLEKIFSSFSEFQSKKNVISRYSDFLQEENQNSELKEGMFKVGASFGIKWGEPNSDEDIVAYCRSKNILLQSYFENQSKNEKKLKEWKKNVFIEQIKKIFNNDVIFGEETYVYRLYTYFLLHRDKSELLLNNINLLRDSIDWLALSSEENFDWSIRNLEMAKELGILDWIKISQNNSVKISIELIDKFRDNLDWRFVRINPQIYWTEELIAKYEKFIFSVTPPFPGYFESNKNVEWTETLIDKYIEKWNWEYLSKNPSIRFNINHIKKYRNKLHWDNFCKFGNTDWNEVIRENLISDDDWRFLKTNQNFKWSEKLFNRYLKKKDQFFLKDFCEFAKIPPEIIINNQKLWNKQVSVTGSFRRNSDGTRIYTVYHSLWKHLFENRNIIWDDHLMESCIDNIVINEIFYFRGVLSINFIDKYWDFEKTEQRWHPGSYDDDEREITSKFKLIDKIKMCTIKNLSFEDFINNEIKWYDVLFGRKYGRYFYMNPSITKMLMEIKFELSENTN